MIYRPNSFFNDLQRPLLSVFTNSETFYAYRHLCVMHLCVSSASEVTTLWRYTNLFIIIIIIIMPVCCSWFFAFFFYTLVF